jgi:hypothetical protein
LFAGARDRARVWHHHWPPSPRWMVGHCCIELRHQVSSTISNVIVLMFLQLCIRKPSSRQPEVQHPNNVTVQYGIRASTASEQRNRTVRHPSSSMRCHATCVVASNAVCVISKFMLSVMLQDQRFHPPQPHKAGCLVRPAGNQGEWVVGGYLPLHGGGGEG